MLVEKDLGEPAVVEHLIDDLRLLLGEHVEVAVVVVAHIVVVEPGHAAALVLGAQVLVVPVDNHDLAVGIERGHEQQDHLLHPSELVGIFGGGEVVDKLHAHLSRAHLGGVDGAGHQCDGLTLVDQGAGLFLAQLIGVGQLPGDLTVALEIQLVALGGQNNDHHLVVEGRATDLLDRDPIGSIRYQAQVFEHLGVGGELAIGSHRMAEKALG